VKRCLEKRPADRYRRTEELRRALERYVAQRVPVNPNGRLVLYLHNCQLITREDAKTYVHPDELEAPVSAALDAGAIDVRTAVYKPALQANAAVLAAMGLWAAYVSFASLGTGMGYLSVSARPWAEVYIDGRYYDVTPVQKPITLPPGPHTVEFRNKYYEATSRQVQVGPGEMTKVSVELSKPKG
ncbi:MAG TPA: PEGA domain-containing protein, partial [Myxococcota bacterium]|nr:PEGA domain-containing protein [Myxococcota bacterium]